MACNRLTEIAEQQRATFTGLNVYSEGIKQYSAVHRNATQQEGGQDDIINIKGKGTGSYFDTTNGECSYKRFE